MTKLPVRKVGSAGASAERAKLRERGDILERSTPVFSSGVQLRCSAQVLSPGVQLRCSARACSGAHSPRNRKLRHYRGKPRTGGLQPLRCAGAARGRRRAVPSAGASGRARQALCLFLGISARAHCSPRSPGLGSVLTTRRRAFHGRFLFTCGPLARAGSVPPRPR